MEAYIDQIKIKNLIPKFLTFYEKVKNVKGEDERFNLWKEHYNFAVLPPVKDYDERAKALLNNAWDSYHSNPLEMTVGSMVVSMKSLP